MRKKLFPAIAAALLLLVLFTLGYSHDYWLYPERFVYTKGDTLVVRLLVGDQLNPELERPLQREITKRFDLLTPNGTVDLFAELPDSTFPVLTRKLDFEGLALLTMERDFVYTEMSDEQFSESLVYEEMDDVIKLREQIGRRDVERKRYDRSIKALIKVGDSAEGDLYKKVLGQKVEIVLLQNPFLLNPGDELEVQILFKGKPLADKLVRAYNDDGAGSVTKATAKTDERGIARFTLDRKGFWLIRLSHIWPCSECPKADWENHYSTYSFVLD
jgi:uncharacterized GH25 family protein